MNMYVFLIIIITSIFSFSGCKSSPVFRAGEINPEYMIQLLPESCDIAAFVNFKKVMGQKPLINIINKNFKEIPEFDKICEEYDFVPEKDLYSFSMGFSISQSTMSNTLNMVFIANMNYSRKLYEYAEKDLELINEKAGDRLIYKTKGTELYYISFLSDTLVLMGTGSLFWETIDHINSPGKAQKNGHGFIKMILPLDFSALCAGVLDFKDMNMADSNQSNPFTALFESIESLSFSIKFEENNFLCKFFIHEENDEDKTRILAFLTMIKFALSLNEESNFDFPMEFVEQIVISPEDTGVRINIAVPLDFLEDSLKEYMEIDRFVREDTRFFSSSFRGKCFPYSIIAFLNS